MNLINEKKACIMLMRVGPTYPGLLDESEGSSKLATAQYQCLRTVGPLGPDSNVVSPHDCVAARKCYKESS